MTTKDLERQFEEFIERRRNYEIRCVHERAAEYRAMLDHDGPGEDSSAGECESYVDHVNEQVGAYVESEVGKVYRKYR